MLYSVLRILRTFFRLTSITCHYLRLRQSEPKDPNLPVSLQQRYVPAVVTFVGNVKEALRKSACCTREGTRACLWYGTPGGLYRPVGDGLGNLTYQAEASS